MKRLSYAAFAVALAAFPVKAEELTVATAGDQNMVDYINQYLGPLFEKAYPGNTVRAVGTACATNPLPVVVPCHRVLRTDGGLGGYIGGLDAKTALLTLEKTA